MGHGNGIKWYKHLELPADGPAAAMACLHAEPARPPGSSYEFYSAAHLLGQRAQILRDVLAKLGSIAATKGVWTGAAAEEFRRLLRDAHSSHYDQVPRRYDGYAAALRAYAAALDGHRMSIDSARAGVRSALDEYNRVAGADQGRPTPTVPGLPVPNTDPFHSVARQQCAASARTFQAAYNDWVDAVTRCEHAIETVDGDKLHNPHGADAAQHAISGLLEAGVDQLANLAGAVAGLSSVLAVASLVLCPELTVVFFEVAMMASQVKLGADTVRWAAWDEKVTLGDFALDALGAVPVGRTAEAVASARQAVRDSAGLKAAAGKFTKCFSLVSKHGRANVGDAVKALRDNGGLGKSVTRSSWARTRSTLEENWRANRQDMVAYPAEYGRNTVDHRNEGWVQAGTLSVFRVHLPPLEQALGYRVVPDPVRS